MCVWRGERERERMQERKRAKERKGARESVHLRRLYCAAQERT